MRYLIRSSILSVALIGVSGLISGCTDDSDLPEAKTAEHALGIGDDRTTKSIETTRDLKVVKDTKVIDTKTGETIRATTESTPVTVIKNSKERVDVDVNVGETKATSKGDATVPVK